MLALGQVVMRVQNCALRNVVNNAVLLVLELHLDRKFAFIDDNHGLLHLVIISLPLVDKQAVTVRLLGDHLHGYVRQFYFRNRWLLEVVYLSEAGEQE